MATARKLPSGSYRVNLFVGMEDGKRKYKSFTAPTKKEAELLAAQYNMDRKEKPKSEFTVKEAIENYIESKSNILSPATIRKYKSMAGNCYGGIDGKNTSAVTGQEIQAFVNGFALDHAPKTVDCVCGLLLSALKEAEPERSFRVKRPAMRKAGMEIPTETQVKILIEEAGSPEMECAFLLAAALGLRRSEISALTWRDMDDGMLRVNKAMVQDEDGNWVTKGTKTAAGTRNLEMPDYLTAKLNAIRPENAKKGERMITQTPNAITKAFNRAKKRARIGCRFHDLRHYNASVMLALGVPDKYAMQRMGHATPNMLKNVYQHLIDEKEKEVAEMVNEKMRGLVKGQAESLTERNYATRDATRKKKNGVK